MFNIQSLNKVTAKTLSQAFVFSRDLALLQQSSAKSARLLSVFPLLFHVYILPGSRHSDVLCKRVEMYRQPSDYVSLRPFPLSPILWKCLLVGLHCLGGHTNSGRLPLMTLLFTVGSNMILFIGKHAM